MGNRTSAAMSRRFGIIRQYRLALSLFEVCGNVATLQSRHPSELEDHFPRRYNCNVAKNCCFFGNSLSAAADVN